MSNALTWDLVRPRIEAADVTWLQAAVIDANEQERQAIVKPFTAYVRSELRQELWDPIAWDERRRPFSALVVVAVGFLPSASAAAALLSRADLREHWEFLPAARMIEICGRRGVPWLGDLALRLGEKVSGGPEDWRPVAELIAATNSAPPAGDRFLRGWVSWAHFQPVREWAPQAPTLEEMAVGRLRWGGFLDALRHRLLEIDDMGTSRGFEPIPETLVALAEQGELDRRELFDRCVARLHHPGRPGILRMFTDLHERLKPTIEELTEHAADYTELTAAASSEMAGFAQRQLKTVEEAGRLDLELLLQDSPSVLGRTEKGLVKAQLEVLDRAARSHPDRAGEISLVVATAFEHPGFDLQKRALAVVTRHKAALTEVQRKELAITAEALSPDLQPLAEKMLGLPVGSPAPILEVPAAPVALPARPPAVLPAIADHDELRATLASGAWGGDAGQLDRERLMAGLVAQSSKDRAKVAALLADEYTRILSGIEDYRYFIYDAPTIADESWADLLLVHGNSEKHKPTKNYQRSAAAILNGEWPPGLEHTAQLARVIGVLRMVELRTGLAAAAPPPILLATPTDISGSLDPEVLLERITTVEQAGREPWPLDLEQALFRLPREVDPAIVARAARLRSPAGITVARWLAAGAPADPIATVVQEPPVKVRTFVGFEHLPGFHRPPRGNQVGRYGVALTMVEKPRSGLHRLFFTLTSASRSPRSWQHGHLSAALVLPHHREVAAAWSFRDIDSVRAGERTELLPSGTDSGGPAGPALTLLLAFVLGADRAPARVAGTDAILSLSAAGNLDPVALGDQLGALIADGTVLLNRIVPPLGEAARAGAVAATWDIIATMLPSVLATKKSTGVSDLLALGVEVATAAGRRDMIPALAEVAARTGSSQMLTQARRLQHTLTRP